MKLWTAQLQKLRWPIEFSSKLINYVDRVFWSISSCVLVFISNPYVLTPFVFHESSSLSFFWWLSSLTWHKNKKKISSLCITCCRICPTDSEQKSQSNSGRYHFYWYQGMRNINEKNCIGLQWWYKIAIVASI